MTTATEKNSIMVGNMVTIQIEIHLYRSLLTICISVCTFERNIENGAEPKMPSLSAIIRDSGLTLSELHRRSGVGRITLSRITNGRQAISRQTADKLAPVLGISAEELIQAPSTQPAAPEVLRISALRLKQWGETRRAEEELPELVSRLIRTELFAAGFIRAPSDERIIEPGPDIAVNNPARATRHVPCGQSVWEVSTRADVTEEGDRGFEPTWPADRMAAGDDLLRLRDDTVLAGGEGVGVSAALPSILGDPSRSSTQRTCRAGSRNHSGSNSG